MKFLISPRLNLHLRAGNLTERATAAELASYEINGTLASMLEPSQILRGIAFNIAGPQPDCDGFWNGLPKNFRS